LGSRRAAFSRAPGSAGSRHAVFTWHLAISPASCPPDSVCFPHQGQKKRANRKEPAVLLIIAVLLLALILFGVGFAVHVLWWIALIVLALWLLGFLFRTAEGGGSRRRWYRW
jgi:Flp pilus assembly protein TadB